MSALIVGNYTFFKVFSGEQFGIGLDTIYHDAVEYVRFTILIERKAIWVIEPCDGYGLGSWSREIRELLSQAEDWAKANCDTLDGEYVLRFNPEVS